MPSESAEQPRQYNEVAARRFLGMLGDVVQVNLHVLPGEEGQVIEHVVDTYKISPPEDESHADVKAEAALDMLSNRLLMSPRKRVQIVRGIAHREIAAQLKSTSGQDPDMSTAENQAKIDDLVLKLAPHMILGQIARHYGQLQIEAEGVHIEQYPPVSLQTAIHDFRNFIIDLRDEDKITSYNAVGFMVLFGVEGYSDNPLLKTKQKIQVAAAKNILSKKLESAPLTPTHNRLRKISQFETQKEMTVSDKLNSLYADYMKQEKMDVAEARRRLLIDSYRVLSEVFSSDQ